MTDSVGTKSIEICCWNNCHNYKVIKCIKNDISSVTATSGGVQIIFLHPLLKYFLHHNVFKYLMREYLRYHNEKVFWSFLLEVHRNFVVRNFKCYTQFYFKSEKNVWQWAQVILKVIPDNVWSLSSFNWNDSWLSRLAKQAALVLLSAGVSEKCHLAWTANLLILYNDFLCQVLLELQRDPG